MIRRGSLSEQTTIKGWEIRGKRIKSNPSFQQRTSKFPLETRVKQERVLMVSSLAEYANFGQY